jgi:hypothetical protein
MLDFCAVRRNVCNNTVNRSWRHPSGFKQVMSLADLVQSQREGGRMLLGMHNFSLPTL